MQIFGENFCFFSQKLPKINPKLVLMKYLGQQLKTITNNSMDIY